MYNDARQYPRTGNMSGAFGYSIRQLERRVQRIEKKLGLDTTTDPRHSEEAKRETNHGQRS